MLRDFQESMYVDIGEWGAYAKTTATATTTPENNDLFGSMTKTNRAARAARTLSQFFDVVCQMTT